MDEYSFSENSLKEHLRTWENKEKTKPKIDFMWEMLKKKAPESVLDVGCGIGHYKDLLPFNCKYTGIDICPQFIEEGKKKYSGIDIRIGNAYTLDFPDNSYDLVMGCSLLIHLNDQFKALRELFRVAKQFVYIIVLEGRVSLNREYDRRNRAKIVRVGDEIMRFTYHALPKRNIITWLPKIIKDPLEMETRVFSEREPKTVGYFFIRA